VIYVPGQTIAGRWRVLKVLQGGLGRVYITLDLEDQVPLAIKTFLGPDDALDRFRQEAHTWTMLGYHPNVVQAVYVLPVHEQPYLCTSTAAISPGGSALLACATFRRFFVWASSSVTGWSTRRVRAWRCTATSSQPTAC
jgi:hypothetical protein